MADEKGKLTMAQAWGVLRQAQVDELAARRWNPPKGLVTDGKKLYWDPEDPEVELEVLRAVVEEMTRPEKGWGLGYMVFKNATTAEAVGTRVMNNRATEGS